MKNSAAILLGVLKWFLTITQNLTTVKVVGFATQEFESDSIKWLA